jgi:trans-aconitate methyltransferase
VPLNHGYSCCDLGCGQGLSTNVFAACHPEGQFHAIDFNRAHILGASGLAEQARLKNVTFWEATFDDLVTLPLPEFDFITLHGVYSWVNAANRELIIDFIRTKLKVGGVVYISYNCLPGWSPIAPIRQLLISYADMESAFLEEQINASIAFVERLKSMNLSYFNVNPSAGSFFDAISKLSRNYLAHEYFNKDWIQFYHADVVKDFASAEMSFVGSASVVDNLDFLRFSLEEQQLLKGIEDSILKETVKDFAANTRFRRDVFSKCRKRLAQTAFLERFSQCRFALIVLRKKDSITLNFPHSDAHFDPSLYQQVLRALDEQHLSLEELLLKPDIARFGSENVHHALMVLLSAGYTLPAVEPSPQALASTRLFNYALLERMALHMEPQPLASPVVQSGIQLDWIQRLLLLCELTENADPLSFVSDLIWQQNCPLVKDGVALLTWEENLEELDRLIKSFHLNTLPLLNRLGVV